ncbi:MAG: type II toxin-antitoxin system RelE/ParE family toxin [Planctomycetes bacterium]|nr:type II toxin-antitoxin system RelE/ParE family toxin [Planctomycetota bacterium]
MTFDVKVRKQARRDLKQAAQWYEGQERGLGKSFIAQVDAVLDSVGRSPFLHPVVYKDVRRALVRRFPYAVFYRVTTDTILVLAVAHFSRDPSFWQQRTWRLHIRSGHRHPRNAACKARFSSSKLLAAWAARLISSKSGRSFA